MITTDSGLPSGEETIVDPESGRPPPEDAQEVPERIGRHVVERRLGAGGMGVVYAAHDPELDRYLAIKLVHRVADGGTEATKAKARMRREAQAMAKLSHPNVITIYDVGEHDGQLYIAMEFLEGQSLREWMGQTPRPKWQAIVDVFLQAGAGLAAAHRADLVHRDFKPDNVMVDAAGVVRVLDFGLAHPTGESMAEEPSTQEMSLEDTHLTRTGALVGTPAYMSLEQMEGRAADARSDQFSFCVAMWEALYGKRPHRGDDLPSLVYSLTSGEIAAPPREIAVPGALRRVLERGLSPEPDARFPTMNALLKELRKLRGGSRKTLYVAAAALLGVAGVGAGVMWSQSASLCSGAEAEIAAVWGPERKAAVKAALLGSGVGYADTTWRLVEPRMDAWASSWTAAHTGVCEATRVRGEQSEAMLDQQMACLSQHRSRASALVTVLEEASPKILQEAVGAVAALPASQRCQNPEDLEATIPMPDDPKARAEVQEIRDALARVDALDLAGRPADGLELATTMVSAAKTSGFEPVIAEAMFALGEMQDVSGEYDPASASFEEAHNLALAVGHDAVAFDAARSMIYMVGVQQGKPDDAQRWIDAATALLRRSGTDPLARARLLIEQAAVALVRGKFPEAEAFSREALAIYDEHLDPEDPRLGPAHADIAMALARQGNMTDAQPEFEAALLNAQARGPDHPAVARALTNLSVVDFQTGNFGQARERLERALPIMEATHGPDHPQVASILNNLGGIAYNLRDLEAGLGYHQRAMEIRRKTLGEEHPDLASSHNNMANILQDLGRRDEALASYTRAIEIREKALGPEHPALASALSNKGSALIEAERFEDALPLFDRAIKIREKALGPDNVDIAQPLTYMGAAYLAMKNPGLAIAPLSRALALREDPKGGARDPWALASTQFQLGRALFESGKGKARGKSLVKEARAAMIASENPNPDKLAEVDRWLDAHG